MITFYKNGINFINENKDILDTNPYLSVFFYMDSKELNKIDNKNYAIKSKIDNKVLLGIKVEPFSLVLFGNTECTHELFNYINLNKLESNMIICEDCVGNQLIKNHNYDLFIGMDFMECKDKTLKTDESVLKATLDDLNQIYELSFQFFKDCGLPDIPSKEKLKDTINHFSIIKEDGIIVSMASYAKDTDKSLRVTHVYTLPNKRGKGYAKKIVNAIKNEIIDMGFTATLNVDKNNPISYHIYESLGFKKVFTQGIYKKR